MVWDFVSEPKGSTYAQLLDFCSRHCSQVLLVVREWDWLEEEALETLEELRAYQVSATESSEWPGTKLLNETATVYRYTMRPELLDILKYSASGLFDWCEPAKPEDLCLLRDQDTPLLVSISHEQDAYLELTEHEFSKVSNELPELAILLRPHVDTHYNRPSST